MTKSRVKSSQITLESKSSLKSSKAVTRVGLESESQTRVPISATWCSSLRYLCGDVFTWHKYESVLISRTE